MKLSRSTSYALLALNYLVRESAGRQVLAKEIARHYSIPSDYLLKVLHTLVRSGLLESNRGPLGGYRLSRAPEQVTLLEVIEAVEGPFDVVDSGFELQSGQEFFSRVQAVYQQMGEAVKTILNDTTLSKLVYDGYDSSVDVGAGDAS